MESLNEVKLTAVVSKKHNSPPRPCFLVGPGKGIHRLFSKIYVNSFFKHARDTCFILRRWEVALPFWWISSSTHKFAVSPELPMTGHMGEILVKVKTRRPRHLQRSFSWDTHSKICQLSVLSTCLIACQSSCCDAEFLFKKPVLFLILEFNAALLRFWYFFPRNKVLLLQSVMAMPPEYFRFQYPQKFKLVSCWGSLS